MLPTLTTTALDGTLRHFSPRFRPRPMGVMNVAIYAFVVGFWLFALAGAWFFDGLWAWIAGLAYVLYDTWLLVYVALKTRYLLRPASVLNPPVGERLTVAVLIAARNEVDALPGTIERLLAQTDGADEIIVIDDGSTDQSVDALHERYELERGPDGVRRSRHVPALKVVSVPAGGKARALNVGIALSTAGVLLTVDADTALEAGAVDAMRRAFGADGQLVAACGVLTPRCSAGSAAGLFEWFQTFEYVRAFISRLAWARLDSLLLVSGAFAGFRSGALRTVGGFDAGCLVEDYEVIHRLHRYAHESDTRWRVAVVAGARATTDAPGSLLAFLRQRRRWFGGFLQTQYWNRDMTANSRFGALGRVMLPIKALDTMQPIYGLTAFILLITFAASGRLHVFLPVLAVIGIKIVVDLAFYLWWVRLYAHWLGLPLTRRRMVLASLAALAEPFSFQLLRHSGAAWGWYAFLTGSGSWGHAPVTPVPRSGA